MKIYDKYLDYKSKYPSYIIILKEGSFYKTYGDDAIILWYLFDYKWNKNSIGFSINAKEKVVDKLKELELSYLIDDNINNGNIEVYELYIKIAKLKYNKYIKIEEIINIVSDILNKDINKYNDIKNYLINNN